MIVGKKVRKNGSTSDQKVIYFSHSVNLIKRQKINSRVKIYVSIPTFTVGTSSLKFIKITTVGRFLTIFIICYQSKL